VIKKILIILLVCVSSVQAQEVVTSYDNNTLPVLNDETRKARDDIKKRVSLKGNETIYDVKTFDEFPITPSSDPTADYQAANKKYIDDEIDAHIAAIGGLLGAWVDKSSSYGAQQATTDGFILAFGTADENASITGYTDSSNPPTTVRALSIFGINSGQGNGRPFICMPVKKNDYWKVVVSSTTPTVFWIPLGT
jgi:hypothetical protein